MIFLKPYQKYATFAGRASRTEYLTFWLFVLIMSLAIENMKYVEPHFSEVSSFRNSFFQGAKWSQLTFLFLAGSMLPLLAVITRRLHDSNKNGWCFLLLFLPIIGELLLLIFTLLPSTPNGNEYGPSPHPTIVTDSNQFAPIEPDVPPSPPPDNPPPSSSDEVPQSPSTSPHLRQ